MRITDIITQAGGPTALARLLSLHHSTVLRWKRIPAHYATRVAEVTGIALHVIRPDVFPAYVSSGHIGAAGQPEITNHVAAISGVK